MTARTGFIGYKRVRDREVMTGRLRRAIMTEIACGCKFFTVGADGAFDRLALSVCKSIRRSGIDISIEVVIGSAKAKRRGRTNDFLYRYADVTLSVYDGNPYDKILESGCSSLICYSNPSAHGKTDGLINRAAALGTRVVNLY